MDFISQLKTLLWKNYTLRRKKPLRLIAELIWPLLIFCVLVIIKIRFKTSLITDMDECHFEDVSLPSAGLFSFVRSFYCNQDVPCYSKVKDGLQMHEYRNGNWTAEDEIRHLFISDKISEVTQELETFFKSLGKLNIMNLISNLVFFMDNYKSSILNCSVPLNTFLSANTLNQFSFMENSSLSLQEWYEFSHNFTKSEKPSHDSYPMKLLSEICEHMKILRIPDEEARNKYCKLEQENATKIFEEALSSGGTMVVEKCSGHLSLSDSFFLLKLASDLEKLFALRFQINKTMEYLNEVNDLMSEVNQSSLDIDYRRTMCGPNSMKNKYSFLNLLSPAGMVLPQIQNQNFQSGNKSYNFCAMAMIRYMIPMHLTRGKILYTPVSTFTQNITKLANRTFEDIERLLLLISDIKLVIPDLLKISESNLLEEIEIFMTMFSISSTQSNNFLGFLSPHIMNGALRRMDGVLEFALNLLNCFDLDRFQGVKDEEELVRLGLDHANNKTLFAGLVFLEDDSENKLRRPLKYKIRLHQTFIDFGFKYNVEGETKRGSLPTNPRIKSRFYRSGFVFLQDFVEHAILTLETKNDDIGSVIQLFPSPCYVEDVFKLILVRTLPLFMCLGWILMVTIIVKDIVYEKEIKLKEFMKVMGLSKAVHWCSWFVFYLLSMLISVILLCALLKLGKILEYVDVSLLFVFLIIFLIALISQCFMFSVFFNNSNAAASFTAVAYFGSFLPYRFSVFHLDSMQLWLKLLLSLSSTTAFGLGCNSLALHESLRTGMQWRYIFKYPSQKDQYSFAFSMFMMLFDSGIYLAIALYVEAVFPGTYGLSKPWHFPISGPLKWLHINKGSLIKINKSFSNSLPLVPIETRDNFHEDNQENLPIGVLVLNLTKRYERNQPPAVDKLKAEFYEGQISGLLGHNGAGKTTTMFIMTGLLAATEGTVYIKDLDVKSNIREIRKIISFCPQHNILYDSLTVWQHLVFYARLKGLSGEMLNTECNRIISDVELMNKKNTESRFLSGGMKRRLSVGIAYLGSPKVVILDEPTAGVDARARRFIWDLLLKYKSSRTTIISTHLMEEAEVLSDRLAIIHNGKLYCSGSLMYLKNHFASGYRLTTEIHKEYYNESLRQDLINLVLQQVSGAEVDEAMHVPHGIMFILPLKSYDQFPALFKQLELNREKFSLSNYGVSSPSVEEIFVNTSNMIDENKDLINNSCMISDDVVKYIKDEENLINNSATISDKFSPSPKFLPVSGMRLYFRQLIALVIKRFHYLRRNKKSIFCQMIMPPIFIIAMLAVLKLAFDFDGELDKPLELHPKIHSPRDDKRMSFFLARNDKVKWDCENVEMSLIDILGSEEKCLDPTADMGLSCPVENSFLNISYPNKFRSNFSITCSCSSGHQNCDSKGLGSPPKSSSLSNKDVVYNLTHFDISDYLVETRPTFFDIRFGGIEFTSNTYPKNEILEIAIQLFNTIDQVASGLSINISSKMNKIIKDIEIVFPSLMRDKLAKVWYNYDRPASIVTYLNSLHNAVLRSNDSKISILLYDHPLNSSGDTRTEAQGILEILPPVCILFALSLIPTSFLFVLIEEKQNGFMHIQMISGVHSTLYWISNFIWDFLNYSFACVICIVIFFCFQNKEFVSADNAPTFVSLLFAYGWAVIPLTYPFAYVFGDGNTAYIFTSGGFFFSGLVPCIVMFVFDFIPDDDNWADTLRSIFMVIPQFCLGRGLMEMVRNQISYASRVSIFGKDRVEFTSPLAYDKVGRYITSLLIFGLVMLVLFLVVEYHSRKEFGFIDKILKWKQNFNLNNPNIEEDVLEEEARIMNDSEKDVLVVRNATKIFREMKGCCKSSTLKALDSVTFGVKEAECFGLLGTNGAGKTTLFKILTGDMKPTSGDAILNNFNVINQMKHVRNQFGYCPQFDALNSLMTVNEHLILFSKLRGASDASLKEVCDWGLKHLDLSKNARTLSKNLSGGNKRKLSVAISLIGSPKIVYLDEPTAGVDPRARRSVWNCILGSIRNGLSIVLTSHSLEECEALCSRVAIIVDGSLRCIGTIQYLKSKYSKGYYLNVKFVNDDVATASGFENLLHRNFSNVLLQEQHGRYSTYLLGDTSLQLSKVFQILSDSKKEGTIDDFSINQTRLEHVFLKFANSQKYEL